MKSPEAQHDGLEDLVEVYLSLVIKIGG